MQKKLRYLLLASFIVLTVGCVKHVSDSVQSDDPAPIYVFGDPSYDEQLASGTAPLKLGPIAATEVNSGFPQKYLEPDGSYAGGRVYNSAEAAEQAIVDARTNGLLAPDSGGAVYVLDGKWGADTYEVRPNEYRLKRSLRVKKRIGPLNPGQEGQSIKQEQSSMHESQPLRRDQQLQSGDQKLQQQQLQQQSQQRAEQPQQQGQQHNQQRNDHSQSGKLQQGQSLQEPLLEQRQIEHPKQPGQPGQPAPHPTPGG